MEILLSDVGKKYKRWIVRHVDWHLNAPGFYGLAGANGSGKSTLLRMISGFTTTTEGSVTYSDEQGAIPIESAAVSISIAAPYQALIEELTLVEHLQFHLAFKEQLQHWRPEDFLDCCQLSAYAQLLVGELSSGLMQRFKLGLALLTNSPVVLLDEPTSFMDTAGKIWFADFLQRFGAGRLVVVASNDIFDLDLCGQVAEIQGESLFDQDQR